MSSFAEDFRNFAVWKTGIPDSPARTAAPADVGRPFGSLTEREQLDILGRLYDRNSVYADALVEAPAESNDSDRLFKAALDPDVTPADLGRRFRECLIGYAESVAAHRGDELEDL